MKVLLINTVPTDRNGITGVIFNYLRSMNTEGMTIDLLAINEPSANYIQDVESKGRHVFVIPRLNGVKSYWQGLYRLAKREKYDVAHIHGNSHTVVLELSALWLAGCKVRIVHAHTTQTGMPLFHKLSTPFFNMLYTHGLACGEAAGKWMFGKHKFTVLNNGVDTNKYSFNSSVCEQIRKELGWQDCKVVGHVGYFTEVKNHKWIIEVFKELYAKDNSYRLVLIGDGVLRPAIEQQINSCGLASAVRLTGNIDNVDAYLNAIDVILMPSLYEGLPLTLVEQQSNGLKCVVSDTISKEADKTGNVKFISLSERAKVWAESIEKNIDTATRDIRSAESIVKITKAGYSISNEAERLREFYLNSIK